MLKIIYHAINELNNQQ